MASERRYSDWVLYRRILLVGIAAALAANCLWECGCAEGTMLRAGDVRPGEEVEQALLERVREARAPETESIEAPT